MFVGFAFVISEKSEDKINREHCSELLYLLSSVHIPAVRSRGVFLKMGLALKLIELLWVH